MTILGTIVLAAAIAAPAGGQQNSTAPQGNASKPERNSPAPEPDVADVPAPVQIVENSLCSKILVSAPQTERRARSTYSASKTLDLTLKMHLNDTEDGAHLVTFRVFTPKGHLYQEIRVPHRSDASGNNTLDLSASFPMAGTAIHTNSLYGVWKVVPHLDGSPEGCAAATAFTVTQ